MKYLGIILFFFASQVIGQSPFIHVDQFGYNTNAKKVAILSDPYFGQNSGLSYSPTDSLELRNAISDIVIQKFESVAWSGGDIDTFISGDRGWYVDFTDFELMGSYYLHDPVAGESSPVFEVGNNVYEEAMKASCRMFYYNRCNMSKSLPYAESKWVDNQNNFDHALQDYNCRFIFDRDNASLEKDLSGGWFDAGDYNKYVTFTHSTIHNLLWAYRINPQLFGDNNNIPESGNGVPDIIDELKWELDWMMKMCNSDGSTHIKMGSQNYSENVSYPPSNNFDQRFYGPTCTSASLTIASVFAHAAYVFEQIPALSSYASSLETQAELAWNYILPFYNNNNLEFNCDNEEIVAGDADFDFDDYQEGIIAAAIYLFELTGKSEYNQFVIDNYLNSLVFGSNPNNPNDVSTFYDDWWDINRIETKDAYLNYKNINGHNASVAEDFRLSFEAMVNNDWEQLFGIGSDLYRAYMPYYFIGWGSSMSHAQMGTININAVEHEVDIVNNELYLEKASAHLHFLHGCNPLGKLFLSNMYDKGGDRCADEIYHTWFYDGSIYDNALTSPNGPAPGFLSGGNNYNGYSGPNTPPANQPMYKSYDDINDVASVSWEITEPAIYYQAAYIRLLSSIMALQDELLLPTISVSNSEINVMPNPTTDFFIIQGELGLYNIDILNSSGQVVQTIDSNGIEEVIDITSLGVGLYFIRMENKTNSALHIQKIIKQ